MSIYPYFKFQELQRSEMFVQLAHRPVIWDHHQKQAMELIKHRKAALVSSQIPVSFMSQKN